MKNLFVLMLFLLFLFFMCVGFSTHVWEFPNRWFFSRLFWRCSWRLILHGRLWKDRYRCNTLYQISKTQIQVQIQKVAPPVWKKTHLFGFLQTCVSFSKQAVLLNVFSLVFEFLIIDIIHFTNIYLFRGAHAISDVKNTFKTALKKITCMGIPTHVWKNPHT